MISVSVFEIVQGNRKYVITVVDISLSFRVSVTVSVLQLFYNYIPCGMIDIMSILFGFITFTEYIL